MGNSKIVYYGETLIDLTGDTVEATKLRKGITAHDKKGEKITGTLADVTQATPAITVDAAGKITASATQAAGVVAAGTKSATKQLTVQAAKTVTPAASAQTAVAKGVFTTGIVTVAAVYAVIGVTYPAGATCTCTNGSTTLTAKDTTGKAMFIIPTKGTWTVKAVKGSQSKSAAVSITAAGQVATVTLLYVLDMYNAGTFGTDSSGTKFSATCYTTNGYNKITENSNDLYWWCDPSTNNLFCILPSIDPSGYSTLKMQISASNMNGAGRFGLATGSDRSSGDYAAQSSFSAFTGAKLLSVDISNVPSGKYYAKLTQTGNSGSATTANITHVWLE